MSPGRQEIARFVRWSGKQGYDTAACTGEELRRLYRMYRAEQGHWTRAPESQERVPGGRQPEIRVIDGVRWQRLDAEQ